LSNGKMTLQTMENDLADEEKSEREGRKGPGKKRRAVEKKNPIIEKKQ
jgi:hypothetical protein